MADILITSEGALGHIKLSRPRALNALSLEMIDDIATALSHFAEAPEIAAVLITGDGERGLCAGGDIRALYDRREDGVEFGMHYFHQEYRMNYQISAFKKPYIAFMDGITMGGGVGISAHGTIRVVTERTRLAMPETGIGFFPDVGASWLLPRAPGQLGTYLALTGQNIGGADAILTGLADYFVESAALPDLKKKLTSLSPSTTLKAIQSIISSMAVIKTAPLASYADEINKCFCFDTVEEILSELSKSNTDFAKETISTLEQKSPTSLKVTLRLVRLGQRSENLQVCLQREYAACLQVLKSHDFYEGVRAAIVDKDRQPHWNPKHLEDVREESLDTYFALQQSKLF